MKDGGLRERFTHNLLLAFLAQGISFLFSVLMSLLVPRLLGVENYAYWQLFIFYGVYVGLFHFGLSDGVYLKYGGVELEEMDKGLIGAQFKLMILWQTALLAVGLPFLLHFSQNGERKFVWIMTAVYLVLGNATWFFGYVFQAANRTSVYSVSIIISRVLYILFIVGAFLGRASDFRPFILFYNVAQGIACLYVLYHARGFLSAKLPKIFVCIRELWDNIRIGINLTISNIVSSLILGIGRMMVDRAQGIASFGLLSLSISLTNFFLQFVSQVSLVMFPMLRQVEPEKAKKSFLHMRSGISFALMGILVFYAPMKWVLRIWIPQYEDSFYYMIFLLPICVFDGKMQMIYNTYLKVLRKERQLLSINAAALIFSAAFCAVSAFGFKNIVAVALSMLLAIVFRSAAASLYLSRVLEVPADRNLIAETILVILFILANLLTDTWIAFLIYLISYLIYVGARKKELMTLFSLIRNVRKKGAQ